jgi:hypothetical protein
MERVHHDIAPFSGQSQSYCLTETILAASTGNESNFAF